MTKDSQTNVLDRCSVYMLSVYKKGSDTESEKLMNYHKKLRISKTDNYSDEIVIKLKQSTRKPQNQLFRKGLDSGMSE